MAWQQPKTNWDTHPKAIEPADMNRIEGNIEAVREQSNMALRLETVSSFPAHTPGRVIYHTGNKRAYVSDGSQWIPIGVEGDAVAANVLSGKKFSSLAAGVGATGTMPNRTGHVTAQGSSISGTTLRFRPQPGYYPGDAGNSVQLSDADFVPANIREGESLFGVQGILRKEPFILIGNVGRVVVPWVEGYTQGPGKVEQLYAPAVFPIQISQGSTEPGDTRTWVTDDPYDLTHFSTLRIGWTPHSGALKACVVSTSKMGDDSVYDARYIITGDRNFREDEINIRSLSGSFYIRVHCVTTTGGNAWAIIAYMTLHQD